MELYRLSLLRKHFPLKLERFVTYSAIKLLDKRESKKIGKTRNFSLSKGRTSEDETVRKLEKLSLVGFDKDRGTQVLEAAVNFTRRLREAEIDAAIEPMTTVLEKENVPLRADVVLDDARKEHVLRNARVLEEEYFVAPTSNPERGFVYGPQGKMFQRNLEKHWFLHSVTMPNYNIFLSGGQKVPEVIADLRKDGLGDAPFGLASLEDCKNSENLSHLPGECRNLTHKVGKVSVFNDASSCKDMFLRKQRERKTWWRKLAHEPSRFALSEGRKTKSSDMVHIVADFDFGKITVESITYRWESRKIFPQLQNEVDADNSELHVVEHAASIDWGCATLLCDSLDDRTPTSAIHIHPKLSPYKVAFRSPDAEVDAADHAPAGDLKRLVLYLNSTLKARGIDTILLGNRGKKSIVKCFVPFVIEVDESSLKNGLVRVTSRSTSLAGTVHITNLTSYIASRCC